MKKRQLPRGISPALLLSQVKNTMPYLFTAEGENLARGFPPAQVLRDFDKASAMESDESSAPPPVELSHFEYFLLCASSHYLSCGTPVPTDVDNQIRMKLWPEVLPLETALQMSAYVLESRSYDFRNVSTRYVYGEKGTDWEKENVSGHLGEWFTLAAGAYCALRKYTSEESTKRCDELFTALSEEVNRHSELFASLMKAKNGIGCLKASASIAHNFGDLDRVMDMWGLSYLDPLRTELYKLGATPFDEKGNLRYRGRLWLAGELYKAPIPMNLAMSSMALENHRHFPLRKAHCLRRSLNFLIPTGPFFYYDWGREVASALQTTEGLLSDEGHSVVECLTEGWLKLSKSVGYGRALAGIRSVSSELLLPELESNPVFSEVLHLSEENFLKLWNDGALFQLEEIPSRA